uniref:Duodenase-1-like n=1 Tax=Pundamilia nyererei TaxID=303518 RepID=A0A3B4H4D0_9CICH
NMENLHAFLLVYVLTCLGQLGYGTDIIHGKKAPDKSMLYMASVQSSKGHVCGGFLVTEDFVVTAAHCDTVNITHVVIGNHNLQQGSDIKIIVERKFKPSNFNDVWLGEDIMLLKLSRKAQLGCKVQIIQLPCAEITLEENQICQVAGWGKTKNGGSVVDDLRVVNVSVINPEVCREQWPGLPVNVICAGGYGTDKGFCQGDSGGPLVCNGLAVGIVSFNKYHNCNYPDVPNVYTDISKYLQWINKVLATTKPS